MSNYYVNFSLKSFYSNGHNNGFHKALIFFIFSEKLKQVLEKKNGNNGRQNQYVIIELVNVNAT